MTACGRLATVAAALALLGGGAAGCGDDSDSSPPADGGAQASETPAKESAPGAGNSAPSGKDDGSAAEGDAGRSHHDTGGGSEQFVVPGGDNSVQEFGSEADETEFDEAAAALHAFLDARASGDWAAACDRLSASVVDSFDQFAERSARLRGKDCPELLAALSGPGTEEARRAAAIADVGALRVEGDRGFVLYHGTGETTYAIPMSREAGEWKVDSLAGLPLS